MIFKKSAMQGNFIFSNGQQALFINGYYKAKDESEAEQLKAIYEEVSEKEIPEKASEKTPAPILAKTGMASSASLAAVTKAH